MAKKMDNAQLLNIVQAELENSMGGPGGDLAHQRALAYDYFMRKPFGNEEHGISKVVSADVMEAVDGVMPSLLRMFTTQENLLSFDGVSEGDESAAEQESDYINHIFFKRNPAFEVMFYWFFDALVQINGYVKCYWDKSQRITTERYEGLEDEELLDLLEDDELEPVEREERVVEIPVEGQMEPIRQVVHDVKFRRVTEHGQIRVVNVPPEELRVTQDCRSMDLSGARGVFHVRNTTRTELLEMGFDKKLVNELPSESDAISQNEEQARKDRSDDVNVTGRDMDRSMDIIELTEAYIKVDMDGDGKAELKQVFIAGGKILDVDDADRQPFHTLPSAPLPHRHHGMAFAEKVMDNQLVTSTLLRQILDNLYHTNNPGHGVWEMGLGDTTMSDLLTRRVGAVTTFKRPVSESYAPMVVPFTAGESFPMLEWFDRAKRNRTGIGAGGEGLEPERLKHIQRSVMATQYDQSKEKIELLARIFAETGFKTLFLHMHELVLKHQRDADIVRLRGSYVRVDPQEWRTRYDMTVNIGLGIGSREQNLLYLDSIFEKQLAIATGGGANTMVTAQNIANTVFEMVKNANYKTPEMFFTMPPPDAKIPAPSDEQLEVQKQQQALQEQKQALDAERQKIKSAELQLKARQQEIDAKLEVMALQEKAEEREDKYEAENQKLRNTLLELEKKFEGEREDRELQKRRTAAEIDEIRSRAAESRARIAKIMEEVEAQNIENAATESGVLKLVESDGESEGS